MSRGRRVRPPRRERHRPPDNPPRAGGGARERRSMKIPQLVEVAWLLSASLVALVLGVVALNIMD
jgi:hypothetical protein